MKNYSICKTEVAPRIELHDKLGLTGSEISLNTLPKGACVPFIHSHKQNEEVYFIVEGDGKFNIDGEEIAIKKGVFIKIAPQGKRQIFAGDNGITYICIQAKENSLEEYTAKDAII